MTTIKGGKEVLVLFYFILFIYFFFFGGANCWRDTIERRRGPTFFSAFGILDQAFPVRVVRKGRRISDDKQAHFCPCNCNVHSSNVGKKAQASSLIWKKIQASRLSFYFRDLFVSTLTCMRSDAGKNDDIFFSSLESVLVRREGGGRL